jgi:peptide/nickel transport system ATP-binding protein
MSNQTIPLHVRDLSIHIDTPGGVVEAVNGASFEVIPGEILAIVGESGSGKTLTARAILGMFPPRARVDGVLLLNGNDVLAADPQQLRRIRGEDAAMIFQEPSTALNPVFRIGWQMGEGLRAHGMTDAAARRALSIRMLRAVGIPDPESRIDYYPHQFSGGQKQRVVIAMALALRPSLIVADEPTTALDVTVQAEILDLLRSCRDEFGASIVLITHNMGVVADLADRVAVMYRGEMIEQATVEELFAHPREEYTQQLLAAVPRLGSGRRITRPATTTTSVLTEPGAELPQPAAPLVVADTIDISYSGGFRQPKFHAVRKVSFTISAGEVLGLVGESGSGKSTIGKAIGGLEKISSGSLSLFGQQVSGLNRAALRETRRRIGYVFQDPASSFNPFMTVEECIAEPMRVHHAPGGKTAHRARALELLDAVQLPLAMATRRPYELSGGQRQRVGLARALALDPDFIIADEPTSALDVSVQAKVLDIFTELQRELGFGSLFISHDLAVIELLADRVGVLRRGELVELGTTDTVLHNPQHEYTQALIAAVPVPDPIEQRSRKARALLGQSAQLVSEERGN